MKKIFIITTFLFFIFIILFWIGIYYPQENGVVTIEGTDEIKNQKGIFIDGFQRREIIEETGEMEESIGSDWWVNSGAFLIKNGKIGKTLQGKIKKDSVWQKKYEDYNSESTDGGYRPQNIFRLVTKSKWQDFQQEVYFRIVKYNLSKSKHRNQSNGLLLFNRYLDGDNLYYTGIRVDGAGVIKKKIKGEYFTLAYEPIFNGRYDIKTNSNLLPENTWIGLKSEVVTTNDNNVNIKLFLDKEGNENWELILEVTDDNKSYGGDAILKEGYSGIRTDFMDVEFDDYYIKDIGNSTS